MKSQLSQNKQWNQKWKTAAFVILWAVLLTILLSCILYHNQQISVNGTLAEISADKLYQEDC